ncbi:MAG TPA: aspartate 1-decarboxylase [Deltaproteobacteria bacterium]|nr:MAG: aspartate 1-decarboxylase [Deltaproteobacteria bacterium GWA2_42_85]OGP25926.1 MAG: aspartate 1-decarboxylase [Deltaproteobacteria bacterium GWB2_42_7]OGP42789.1 MAG: aspartate 1-decarboxylase [Deltaproteobacteria bacterium GWD2_42_10]OGP45825.1 MAG: aspartate 1-decarboxylase [Deltaproteobacteria bacterium GWF2_42_12]OGQ38047.1 MAG: aspartate 1-decarboxylase [Deltaproteobacteria bacterium RIFCSPLOWO2_02_FULL_42_39]OGQ72925.1 MAG: aspartate 1-decarboxylase [Deltaproteobacteria bacterium
MQRIMLKSKIHRATVTDANVDYEGSITLDEDLMETAGLLPFEQVHIYNITNGQRFQTYVIRGERGMGEVCINGAAAHLAKKGHIIIIASYVSMEEAEAINHQPILVYVDEKNKIKAIKNDYSAVIGMGR